MACCCADVIQATGKGSNALFELLVRAPENAAFDGSDGTAASEVSSVSLFLI